MQNALQEQGYAFAKVDAPIAYEAAASPEIDVKFHVTSGSRVNVGEIHIEGLQRTHEPALRRALQLQTGEPYKSSAVERGRRNLLALGVFSQVIIQVGTAVDDSGGVPITFKVRERPRHAVTVNAAYSSDLGGSGGVTWTDRNLFGNAEQLNIAAKVIGLGGSDTTGIGYDTSAKFTKPDFLRPRPVAAAQRRRAQAVAQAYDQTSTTAGVTVNAQIVRHMERQRRAHYRGPRKIIQPSDDVIDHRASKLFPWSDELLHAGGVTAGVSYDSTDLPTPLEDPRHGFRGSLSFDADPRDRASRCDFHHRAAQARRIFRFGSHVWAPTRYAA